MANLLTKLFDMFVNILPENATRTAKDDPGLTIKTSPMLWPYEIFVLEWERRTLLRDLELLVKRDSRLDRANYVMANAATRGGITVTVGGSRNSKIQKAAQGILDKLLKDTKLNAHLPAWARTALRDGDIFLNIIPEINPDGTTAHITRIKNLPAISMERLDDMTDSFPDLKRAFLQIDPITRQEIQGFPLWSVNHIRWKYEPGERYGRSQYYSGRPMWKKLQMTEEDMVVRRRTRAVQRRVHIVGNKDNPGNDIELKKYIKDNRLDDPKNSRITADYFINGLGDVRNLEGDAHLDHIKDVEYLLENAMIGTGVPLHILGFGRNVNRDVVEDQKRTYKEDVKGIQDLLEHGDPGTFSGIRAIFNMALALGGLNPEDVNINIGWAQLDEMTFGEATDTVLKLRAAQPKPQITAKRGLTILAPFLDFDNEQAIEDELSAIEDEIASDKAAQAVEANAVNPEKPSPVNIGKSAVVSAGRANLDSVRAGKSIKKSNPLWSDKMAKLESDLAGKLKDSFSVIAQKLATEKFIKNIAHLTGQSAGTEQVSDRQKRQAEVQLDELVINSARVDLELLQDYILGQFNLAWTGEEETLTNTFFSGYLQSIGLAEDMVHKDIRSGVDFNLVSKEVQGVLNDQVRYRLKGIQETTQKNLMKVISEAYENGDNVAGYISRMQDIIDVPEWRLKMIARSEMAYAFNTANLKYQTEAGYTRFKSQAVVDSHSCQFCLEKNGEIFDISDDQPPYHPRCYDKETEVYTDKGWLKFSKLEGKEKFLSLSPETHEPEWVGSINSVSYPYEGEMVTLKSNSLDMMVTPNHQMYIGRRRGDKRVTKWEFIDAVKLQDIAEFYINKTCNWVGNQTKYVDINGLQIEVSQFAKFMGYYLSEGSVIKRSDNCYQISIAQEKEDNYQKIYEDIKDLPVKVNKGQGKFYINSIHLGRYLEQLGQQHIRYVPDEIKELPRDILKLFIDAYTLGDGSVKECNWKEKQFKSISKKINTCSPRMAADLGEVILKMGKYPSFSLHKVKGNVQEFRNGAYTINHDMWTVYINNTKRSVYRRDVDQGIKIGAEDYRDMVYCVELEKNHILWVRRNGKAAWCGNCRCIWIPID